MPTTRRFERSITVNRSRFPDGAEVSLYEGVPYGDAQPRTPRPQKAWRKREGPRRKRSQPPGPALATQTVAPGSSTITFTDVPGRGTYWVGADVDGEWVIATATVG